MDTYQTYNFYVETDACGGRQSNVTTATTLDIAAPSLSIIAGPGMEQVTYTFTGVPGSDGVYNVYGKPAGATQFGSPITYYAAAGETKTITTDAWGILAYMQTYQTYIFYVETWSGSRIKSSNLVSATTFDIDAPQVSLTREADGKTKLTWNPVPFAQGYAVYAFFKTQNQWNPISNGYYDGNLNIYYYVDPVISGETQYYYVGVWRTSRNKNSNIVSSAFYGDQNYGNPNCSLGIGEPVNVSSGNMYLNQTDYHLPGIGEAINVSRSYNSQSDSAGFFGAGWSTVYDETSSSPWQNQYDLRLSAADGRAIYFGRTDLSSPFISVTRDFYGQIVKNADNSYTLTFKDGRVHQFSATGKLLWQKDRNGNQTTLNYNGSGYLTAITDAFGRVLTVTPNANGTIQQISDTLGTIAAKDALNHTTTLTYDNLGRLTQVKDANNKTTNFAYDARARLTSATNALNFTTSFEYDLNNRLKKTTHPDATFMSYSYDLAGRRTQMTDERNNTTNYGYDNAYRLISMTDALNHTTSFGYDLMSNLTARTDALNQTTNYEYDDFNRLKKAIYPPAISGATRLEERLEYNTVGNVKKRFDTANRETLFDYDTANRLIKTTDALNQIKQFEYNPRSQMTKVKDALNQEYLFTYDALGRQLLQTRAGTTMSYQYDAVGNRTKRTDYTGRETNYSYDVLNRLTEIDYVNEQNLNASYGYDDLSRLEFADNKVGTVSFAYDNAFWFCVKKLAKNVEQNRTVLDNLKFLSVLNGTEKGNWGNIVDGKEFP